ncbi:hypothetical protein LXL04_039719 [Taraxacum kok-saghyz]
MAMKIDLDLDVDIDNCVDLSRTPEIEGYWERRASIDSWYPAPEGAPPLKMASFSLSTVRTATTATTNIKSKLHLLKTHRFKVSCNENPEDNNDKTLETSLHIQKVDRRNMILGIGGVFIAGNLPSLPLASADVISSPSNLSDCTAAPLGIQNLGVVKDGMAYSTGVHTNKSGGIVKKVEDIDFPVRLNNTVEVLVKRPAVNSTKEDKDVTVPTPTPPPTVVGVAEPPLTTAAFWSSSSVASELHRNSILVFSHFFLFRSPLFKEAPPPTTRTKPPASNVFFNLPNELNPKPSALTDSFCPVFTQLRRCPLITNKPIKDLFQANPEISRTDCYSSSSATP